MILLGPATWLVLSLIDSLSSLSERLDLAHLTVPSPPETVKDWPLVGQPIYQFWDLASTNLQAALVKIAPQLRPVGSGLLPVAAEAGTGALQFLIALIVAGFLFRRRPRWSTPSSGSRAGWRRSRARPLCRSSARPSARSRAA